jgi:hypothetical protein
MGPERIGKDRTTGIKTMKLLLLLILLAPTVAYSGGLYIGLMGEVFSRGGWIIGYKLDPKHNVEFHMMALPHCCGSYGITLKSFDSTAQDRFALVGYTKFISSNGPRKEPSSFHGFNVGIGGNSGAKTDNYRPSWEIGGGAGYSFGKKKWNPNLFVGFGLIGQ